MSEIVVSISGDDGPDKDRIVVAVIAATQRAIVAPGVLVTVRDGDQDVAMSFLDA